MIDFPDDSPDIFRTVRQHRFVHLGFAFPSFRLFAANPTIEQYLNSIGADWYRYGGHNYVIWTNAELNALAIGLSKQPVLTGIFVLATEFKYPQYGGLMPQQFWDWINKPRVQ